MQASIPKVENVTPVTGRMISEENEIHNVVDEFGGLKTVGIENSAVHEGTSFTFAGSGQVAAGQTLYFMGVTDEVSVHLHNFLVKTDSAPVTVEFYEGVVTSNDGTQQTTLNRNRQSVVSSTMLVFAGPTVTNDGTQLINARILGTQQTVSSENLEGEWLLKKNTKYTFKITNDSVQLANIAAAFNWIEKD